ncbi:MAG: divalent-cation tolerance protein CutA [Deltaproteobacteria bacterium]|nr:divalent-cation tolerance protein CutA [Deltaproteobacteria bacterium]
MTDVEESRNAAANVVVLVTAPSPEKAQEIARTLVEERLAACVNTIGAVRSTYRWEEKVQDDVESLLVIKTRTEAFERLRARVLSLHPYQCPEVIALPIVLGHAPYLEWLGASVGRVS